jgi:hypothetical protein
MGGDQVHVVEGEGSLPVPEKSSISTGALPLMLKSLLKFKLKSLLVSESRAISSIS